MLTHSGIEEVVYEPAGPGALTLFDALSRILIGEAKKLAVQSLQRVTHGQAHPLALLLDTGGLKPHEFLILNHHRRYDGRLDAGRQAVEVVFALRALRGACLKLMPAYGAPAHWGVLLHLEGMVGVDAVGAWWLKGPMLEAVNGAMLLKHPAVVHHDGLLLARCWPQHPTYSLDVARE